MKKKKNEEKINKISERLKNGMVSYSLLSNTYTQFPVVIFVSSGFCRRVELSFLLSRFVVVVLSLCEWFNQQKKNKWARNWKSEKMKNCERIKNKSDDERI